MTWIHFVILTNFKLGCKFNNLNKDYDVPRKDDIDN